MKIGSGNQSLVIAMIGTLPPPIGGVTVLYKILMDYLVSRKGVYLHCVHIQTGQCGLFSRVVRAIRVLFDVTRILPKVDVVALHVPTPVLPLIGPPCVVLSRIFHKPILVRKFGGTDYKQFGWLRRKLSTFVVRNSSIYLAEAQKLVEIAKADGAKNAYWFPNNRPLHENTNNEGHATKACQRFVYIGQIRVKKGVREIAKAVSYIDADSTVDIYGPFYDGLSVEDFRGSSNLAYKGILEPEEVVSKLQKYDALLLPTYHDGEGYPGVILEAFNAGIPVICTRWRYLPEIVDETCGIFVDDRSVLSLSHAMIKIARDCYLCERLKQGARERAKNFDSGSWNEKFYTMCKSLRDRVDYKDMIENDLYAE